MAKLSGKGGIFVKTGEGVNANAIAAKLRGDGALSHADPRTIDGFGADGEVSVAIHPAEDGYFPIVDSADGAQGIGAGGWSALGLLTNHLHTEALWYRVYVPNLALGVRFKRASTTFVVHAGTAADVAAWLDAEGAPLAAAVPPSSAGPKAVVFSVTYELEKYRSGPDEAAAATLAAIANALMTADVAGLESKVESLDDNTRSLALGVLRGEERGQTAKAISELVKAITAAPLVTRKAPKEESFGEIVLQRAAVTEPSDEVAAKLIGRLDAIEVEAQSRSSWAGSTGLWTVASTLTGEKNHARAHLAWAALARRKEPHWLQVNLAVSSLLNSTAGKIDVTPETQATLTACESRVNDLGEDAQNAIFYNLACAHARIGDPIKALDYLARCQTIREQNPNPEQDTDLESLWKNPEFNRIIAKKVENGEDPALDDSVQDLEDFAKRLAYDVPPARAVPRIKIDLVETGDEEALINRIGGLPCAPAKDSPWPASSSRPMQLVVQLVGKAAGGEIDLGDIHVMQIFADMEGEYYEENQVVVHRTPCQFVLDAPAGCEPLDVRTMTLSASADDAILLEDETDDASEERDAARKHAWCDKIFGIPVGGNLPDEVNDSKGAKMRLLLELMTYDDYFLWALFTTADFSEMKLEVVRG